MPQGENRATEVGPEARLGTVTHEEHVALLRGGVPAGAGGAWADLGSGRGAFTLALADLLGPGGVIHSVDRDAAALRDQERAMRASFPDAVVHYHVGDFTRRLPLSHLDGLVIANALHFVAAPEPVVERLCEYVRPGGRIVLVEYDAERGNAWVPHPISLRRWSELAGASGLVGARRLAGRPSRFLGEIYSALAFVPGGDVSRFTVPNGC
jgi:SAM-dependent methyltransferase